MALTLVDEAWLARIERSYADGTMERALCETVRAAWAERDALREALAVFAKEDNWEVHWQSVIWESKKHRDDPWAIAQEALSPVLKEPKS